ncbi:MAG TPA: [FeFe] hydrogenase H-cluster radical SAM maturase HydE [Firmicutes bacterium]|jgi:biotin synthase|nr:[FeFe] hydrogenase H-cluster radical SAM maturase HydE [Bacillota bacterium]
MGGGPLTLNPRNRKARDIELEVSEPATGRVEFPLIGTDRKRVEGLDVACIIPLLQACPGDETESLFACADRTRKGFVGDSVHIRGIIEFSNYCVRSCMYCGLRRDNRKLRRYRMTPDEILAASENGIRSGYRTIVLQSGEDPYYSASDIARIVEGIKAFGDVAVTLSVGERPRSEYATMKAAGADRFLLKHETADAELYRRLHPGASLETRIECLQNLKGLGFQVGSGFIIGLPGQDIATIARDITLLKELDVEMAGIGPFIPHPDTPLASYPAGDVTMTLKALAVARLALPHANLPVTTALSTLQKDGRQLALSCGGNVIMPNITPAKYRELYEIYPDSASLKDPEDGGIGEIAGMLKAVGRGVSATKGDTLPREKRPIPARDEASFQ